MSTLTPGTNWLDTFDNWVEMSGSADGYFIQDLEVGGFGIVDVKFTNFDTETGVLRGIVTRKDGVELAEREQVLEILVSKSENDVVVEIRTVGSTSEI